MRPDSLLQWNLTLWDLSAIVASIDQIAGLKLLQLVQSELQTDVIRAFLRTPMGLAVTIKPLARVPRGFYARF